MAAIACILLEGTGMLGALLGVRIRVEVRVGVRG